MKLDLFNLEKSVNVGIIRKQTKRTNMKVKLFLICIFFLLVLTAYFLLLLVYRRFSFNRDGLGMNRSALGNMSEN